LVAVRCEQLWRKSWSLNAYNIVVKLSQNNYMFSVLPSTPQLDTFLSIALASILRTTYMSQCVGKPYSPSLVSSCTRTDVFIHTDAHDFHTHSLTSQLRCQVLPAKFAVHFTTKGTVAFAAVRTALPAGVCQEADFFIGWIE